MKYLLVLFAIAGTFNAEPVTRIYGGEPTTIEEYPFMVNVQTDWWINFWAHICGGTLISRTAVLSAARCYVGQSVSLFRVLLGTAHSSSGGVLHLLRDIVVHEDYNSNVRDFDVAILKLTNAAELSESIQMAPISGRNYVLPDGAAVTTMGWGFLNTGYYAINLNKAEVNIVNQATCQSIYVGLSVVSSTVPPVSDYKLCTLGVNGQSQCTADSGGPLVHNNVVVGITSYVYLCGHEQYPVLNTRISTVIDWIIFNTVNG